MRIDKKRLVPEDTGRLLTAFLESFFTRYVEYNFTADLEEKLDEVSNHDKDYKEVLREFWTDFNIAIGATKDLRTTQVLDNLNAVLGSHIFPAKEDGSDPRGCPSCAAGQLSLKLGKFGAFIGCSNYPECKFTRTLAQAAAGETPAGDSDRPGVRVLGFDPETGEEITSRDGRFGPYLQLGEAEKPKRSSIPKGLNASEITLEQAVALLSLPREVARHPETKEPIVAGIGRFGPYVQHGKMYASLTRDDDILSIGANRAIDLIITKEQGGGGRFGSTEPGRPLGDHPDGGVVSVKSGKFGSYVNWGKVNATIPKGTNAEALTLPEGIALLAARAAAAPSGGRVLGEHTAGGPITLRDGRYGAYVSHGKVNATIPKGTALDTVTLEDAIRWIDDKGGPDKKLTRKAPKKGAAKTSAAVKKPAAKKPAVKVDDDDEPPFDVDEAPKGKAAARKAPAKAAAKKSAAKKKAPAKKKAVAKKK